MTAVVATAEVDRRRDDFAACRTARRQPGTETVPAGLKAARSSLERISAPMNPVFVSNLQARSALSQRLRDDLAETAGQQRFTVPKHGSIGHDHDPHHIYVVERGMACRRQVLENGEHQVTCLILPGEICDPFSLYIPFGRSPMHALTEVGGIKIAMADIRRLMSRHGEFETALQWQARVASDIQHMWIGNLGRRPALGRMAHFFCEIAIRLDTVGLVRGGTFDFLLTQSDLANILGLSVIHTNRVLHDLKSMRLLELHSRTASISCITKLKSVAQFNPDYLHLHNI